MLKKTSLVGFALILFFSTRAQDTVRLSLAYQPNAIYNQNTTQSYETELSFSGTNEVMEALSQQGLKNPTISKVQMNIIGAVTSGAINASNRFPVQLEIKKIESNVPNAIANNAVFYGTCLPNRMPIFDSVSAGGIQSSVKDQLLSNINSLFSQTKLPLKTFKVGEEFLVTTPLNFPVGKLIFQMKLNTFYTLTEIKNGDAFFSVRQEVALVTEVQGITMTGKGKGLGKIVYNINASHLKTFQNNMHLELEAVTPEFTMKVKSYQTSFTESEFHSK